MSNGAFVPRFGHFRKKITKAMKSANPDQKFGFCVECGADFHTDFVSGALDSHLVEAHGYKRVGTGRAYKSRHCFACEAPGLYMVGVACYCRKHKDLAVAGREHYLRTVVEPKATERKEQDALFEGRRKYKDTLHSIHRGRDQKQ